MFRKNFQDRLAQQKARENFAELVEQMDFDEAAEDSAPTPAPEPLPAVRPARGFMRQGRQHFPVSGELPVVTTQLSAGFYTLEFHPDRGAYFAETNPMKLPPKLYGNISERADRIINTYQHRPSGTTGVWLSGEKGSGKTLLGRKVAITLLQDHDHPVIILNKPLPADMLGQILQGINTPFVLFLDEFEKIYKREEQEAMLTVLDGVFSMRMLAIITTNDDTKVVDALTNRPGRIFYRITYGGLDNDFVRGFAQDHLNNKDEIEQLVRLNTLSPLNFDQMAAIIEEMNRYNETVQQAIQLLNVDLIASGFDSYSLDGVEMDGQVYGYTDVLTYRLSIDLFDTDEHATFRVSIIRKNLNNWTYRQLLANSGELRNVVRGWQEMPSSLRTTEGFDPSLLTDMIHSHDRIAPEKLDGLPTKLPYQLIVQGQPKIEVASNGNIRATFERNNLTSDPVTLILRRPVATYTKVF